MKQIFPLAVLALFCATDVSFSNEFRVCAWKVAPGDTGTDKTVSDYPILFGLDEVPFASYFAWFDAGPRSSGRLNHCGGALIDGAWLLTARHCLDGKTWTKLGVSVPQMEHVTEGDLAICPPQAGGFPADDVALLRLKDPVEMPFDVPELKQVEAFPKGAILGSWPIRRGVPNLSLQMSPINVLSLTQKPMFVGQMVDTSERVPCGGESGSMMMSTDGSEIFGVLTAISASAGGRPDCNNPETEIYVTPLAGWSDWIDEVVKTCRDTPDACSKPE